jgi:hypothetical protein
MWELIVLGIFIIIICVVSLMEIYHGWKIKKFKLYVKSCLNRQRIIIHSIFAMYFGTMLGNFIVVVNRWSENINAVQTNEISIFIVATYPICFCIIGVWIMFLIVKKGRQNWFEYSDDEKLWLDKEKRNTAIYKFFQKPIFHKKSSNRIIRWLQEH